MKNFAIACALLVLFAASASAADAISKTTLGNMGLGSMQVLNDNDGMAIRGKGTSAHVWGGSVANYTGGSTSVNNYEAAASWVGKPSHATGSSFSFAGVVQVQYGQDPTGSALSVQAIGGFAGGSSSAKAW